MPQDAMARKWPVAREAYRPDKEQIVAVIILMVNLLIDCLR